MCEVCAIFGVSGHWAEAAPVADSAIPAHGIQLHRAARRERLRLLNGWLGCDGVCVRDWDGEAFAVEDRVGRMRIAADLSTLWPAIETMAGRHFDPLQDDGFGPR